MFFSIPFISLRLSSCCVPSLFSLFLAIHRFTFQYKSNFYRSSFLPFLLNFFLSMKYRSTSSRSLSPSKACYFSFFLLVRLSSTSSSFLLSPPSHFPLRPVVYFCFYDFLTFLPPCHLSLILFLTLSI